MIPSALFFAICAAGLVASAWMVQREDPQATVVALFDRMMADRVARIAVIVIWWWLGWHFLAGQTVDPPAVP